MQAILDDLIYPEKSWRQPCLIATFGFPGAGKTAVAALLTGRYPFICLTTDVIRLKYGFSSGPETLQAMYTVTESLLPQRRSVIFDGIHMMRKNRDELRQFAYTNQAQVRFIHVTAQPDIIKQRLDHRAANPAVTAQAGKFVITDEHFQRIVQYYESPAGEPDVIEVDTSSGTSMPDSQLATLFNQLDTWI